MSKLGQTRSCSLMRLLPRERGSQKGVHSETGIASQGPRFSADGFGRLRLSYCPTGSPCLEREDHVAQIFAASREAIVHRRWRQARHFPQDQRVTLQFAQVSRKHLVLRRLREVLRSRLHPCVRRHRLGYRRFILL